MAFNLLLEVIVIRSQCLASGLIKPPAPAPVSIAKFGCESTEDHSHFM